MRSLYSLPMKLIIYTLVLSLLLLQGNAAPSNKGSNFSLKPLLTKLISKQDLTSDETEGAWDFILTGSEPASIGALLGEILMSSLMTDCMMYGRMNLYDSIYFLTIKHY